MSNKQSDRKLISYFHSYDSHDNNSNNNESNCSETFATIRRIYLSIMFVIFHYHLYDSILEVNGNWLIVQYDVMLWMRFQKSKSPRKKRVQSVRNTVEATTKINWWYYQKDGLANIQPRLIPRWPAENGHIMRQSILWDLVLLCCVIFMLASCKQHTRVWLRSKLINFKWNVNQYEWNV